MFYCKTTSTLSAGCILKMVTPHVLIKMDVLTKLFACTNVRLNPNVRKINDSRKRGIHWSSYATFSMERFFLFFFFVLFFFLFFFCWRQYLLLAHLSQRLIGELIGYPWSGVRRRRPSVVHNFKTSSSQKPLGQSKPNFMWSLLG